MPDFREHAVEVSGPGATIAEATAVLGGLIRDVLRLNARRSDFRLFGPDEVASNRLSAAFEATDRAWDAETLPTDDHLAPDGRVMEVLSEHLCQGWLEGYLLTGRHGLGCPMSCSPARGTCRRWRRSRPRGSCATTSPPFACGSSTSST
jgi:xylulose-5-phosphate/fructose-6-phosphate phosphoketolase